MNLTPPPAKSHRIARITIWARAMLAWLALFILSPEAGGVRRHIRQRYRFISLDKIERLICALVLIRSVEIARPRRRAHRQVRNAAPPSFRRRVRRGGLLRATFGSRLRASLRHRDPRERIARLVAAAADIDGYARRYLVPRAVRGLARLYAVILVAPQASALAGEIVAPPKAADSS